MHINAHSIIIIFLLLFFCPSASWAEYDMTKWESWDKYTYLGKCYPSVKIYLFTAYAGRTAVEEDFKTYHPEGDKEGKYTILLDAVPSTNGQEVLFKKSKTNMYCIIMLNPTGGLGEKKVNKDGNLPDVIVTANTASPGFPSTIMNYHLDIGDGFYRPRECTWEWYYHEEGITRTQNIPCDAYNTALVWSPVADTSYCSKASTKIEKSICGDAKLTALDYTLSSNYELIKSAATDAQNTQLTIDQEKWLKQRDTCRDNECIVSTYLGRIDEICTKYAVSLPRPFDCVRSEYIQFKK